jgi:hypothetical protein
MNWAGGRCESIAGEYFSDFETADAAGWAWRKAAPGTRAHYVLRLARTASGR